MALIYGDNTTSCRSLTQGVDNRNYDPSSRGGSCRRQTCAAACEVMRQAYAPTRRERPCIAAWGRLTHIAPRAPVQRAGSPRQEPESALPGARRSTPPTCSY